VAKARQAFIDNGVSLNDFFPPNLNAAPGPVAATDNHIVPLYSYAAAPLGISSFGLKNTSGTTTPYILNTTSLLGTFSTSDPQGLQAISPYFGTLQAYGDQLNTVLNNTTILGKGGYDYWLQNVIDYTDSSNTLSFDLNIWNFSSPSGDFPSNSILHGNGRVVSGEVYEESGPSITIAYPFTLDLYLNTTVGSYLGSPMVNEAYFNYTVINSAGHVVCPLTERTGQVCGMYDNVYFNSAVNVPFGSAQMSANGYQYTPLGLPSDMEMDVGIGQSSGANANVVYSNATVGIYTLNATTKQYQAPPSTYDFGSETGETGQGASVSWNYVNGQPVAYERTGPSLLTGLWNVTGGTDGAPTIGSGSQGAYALNYAGVSPGNAFIAVAQGTGVTNQSFFQVAPTFGWFSGKGQIGQNLWLPAGPYTVEVMLSGYNEVTQNVLLTSNQTLSITLTPSAVPTVYTPLWAYSNADLANLSVSGSGTSGSPYVLLSAQPGSLAPVFGILNDYLFIVYSGIWINSTTAYFEFNPAPSLEITEPTWWYFQTDGLAAAYGGTLTYNQLPMYFNHASNFVVENSPNIGLWSSDIEVGHNFAVYCNTCTNSLFAGNTFNVSSEGLDLLGGGTNQHNYVWGNTFTPFADPANAGMSAPSTGLVMAEGNDHVYNNAFYTNRTLTSTSATLVNFFNATGGYQPASNSVTVSGVSLTGSILGGTTQGGNYYRDYGAYPNPYGVLPYVGRASTPTGTAGIGKGGDFAPLATLPGSCATCRENLGLYPVTFTESGVGAGKTWTVKVVGVPIYEPLFAIVYTSNPTNTSTTSTLGFWLPNGTYSFTASTTTTGFGTGPGTWSFTVNGAGVNPPTIVFATTYTVTFSESGLIYGLTWQVTVNGNPESLVTNGGTDSLTFSVASGTSAYSITVITGWSQSTLPYTGYITVSGAPVTEPTLVYTQGTYAVTFSENGLAAGLVFSVTFNSVTEHVTTVVGTNSLVFPSVPDGTYGYSIATVSGWHESTIPYSGLVAVNGAPLTLSMSFTPVTYSVTFSESGLPSGLTWKVTLNAVVKSLTTTAGADTLTFTSIPNGTYAYSIADNSGYHQSTLPYSGNVVVSGASVTESTLIYNPTAYSVTFSESGLPSGLTWQVTLNGVPEAITTDGATDSVAFSEVNGSYAYSIADNAGYHQSTLAYSGNVGVSGSSVMEPTLLYSAVMYSVTFSESGLPAGLTWQVTVNGVPESTTTDGATDSLAFSETNGTFAYSIADNAGYHQTTLAYSGSGVVSGAAVVEPTLGYSQVTYSVTFSESGLPSGLTWTVTVNGTTEFLTTDGFTDSLAFAGLANGTYVYSIADNTGYHQTTLGYNGNVVVNGASVTEPTLVYTVETYSITFTEHGLPSGSSWSVTIGATTLTSTSTTIVFTEPNGTYSYRLGTVPGWMPNHVTGSVDVTGANAAVSITFTQVTYVVSFFEYGLPGGTTWSVTVNGTTLSSTAQTIKFHLANGTYSYSVSNVANYSRTASGSFTVSGGPLTVITHYVLVTYVISFFEYGLPSGTRWSVDVNGTTISSTAQTIKFHLANGTYAWSVPNIPNYSRTPSGVLHVNGAAVTVSEHFVLVTYEVEFTESGLPTHTSWQVTIGSTTISSTTTHVFFFLGNGTYTYTVSAPSSGYTPTSGSGGFTVNAAQVNISVSFVFGLPHGGSPAARGD
jgi:thermopsin